MEATKISSTNTSKKQSKKGTIKTIFQVVFFTSLAVLAIYYILSRSENPKEIFNQISQIRVFPFLISLLAVFSISFFDGLSIYVLSKDIEKSYTISKGTINAITGNFIAVFNKTASTVIQAKTLAKQGIKSSKIFSVVTMNFLIYQFALVFYSIFSFFISYPVVKDINLNIISGLKISFLSLIGLIINVGILLVILLLAFNKPLHRFILTRVIDLLEKLHLVKNAEETRNRLALRIISYHVECEKLIRSPKNTLLCGVFVIIRLFISNCMPFLTFWILDANKMKDLTFNFFELFCGANFLSLISVYIPSGAPEIAFQTIFANLLGENSHSELIATTGTIVWRIITFLIPFAIGGLFYLFYKGGKDNINKEKYKTMTIYDMQIINLSEESDQNLKVKDYMHNLESGITKKKSTRVLLDKKQVEESFARIKESISIDKGTKTSTKNTLNSISLQTQKDTLRKVIQDTEKLISEKKEFDSAIEKEAKKEKLIQEKYNERKRLRREKRNKKNEEKNLKKLNKHLLDGAKVVIDDNGDVVLNEPDTFEIITKQNRINNEDNTKENDNEN